MKTLVVDLSDYFIGVRRKRGIAEGGARLRYTRLSKIEAPEAKLRIFASCHQTIRSDLIMMSNIMMI
jgi:hypothetical protein